MSHMPTATDLRDDILETLEVTQDVEREVFDAVPPGARDRISVGEWSPKDVVAHLAAWRDRQVTRMEREGRGEPPDTSGNQETDVINAQLHDERAGWTWDQALGEATASWTRLSRAVRAANPDRLTGVEGLIGGIMGNGPSHDLEHLPAVARIAGREQRVEDLTERITAVAQRGAFPDNDAGTLIYNLACWASLDGRLETARSLLTRAFRLRPDLIEYAPSDNDLAALHEELEQLARG
jgi:hypothetical protein